MKKNKYLLLVAASALAITGCDQDKLDIPQKGVISFEDFYQTDADAESALTIAYSTMQTKYSHHDIEYNYGPYFGLTNWLDPDYFFGGTGTGDCVRQRELHQFNFNADHEDILMPYETLYTCILKCNYVISNFTEERLGTLSEVQKRCVAEARALRAFDYLLLAIYWGNPAIVENILTAADKPANAESQQAVLEWVVKEAQLAADDLPWRKGPNDYEGAVRATKAFALAVKGKAQLWLKDYSGAKASLGAIIESGNYVLVPSDKMITIGHADGKGSTEAVFEFNYDGSSLPASPSYERYRRAGWNDHNTFCVFRGGLVNGPNFADERIYCGGWQWLNPTGDFARALIANDGMNSARRKAWLITYDELLYDYKWNTDYNFAPGKDANMATRDSLDPKTKKPVKDANDEVIKIPDVKKSEDPARGIQSDTYSLYGNEGFFQLKLGPHPNQGDQLSDNQPNRNATIMRYAEVLLMYAEACAQLGETSGAGLDALKEVQVRAESEHVSSALSLEEVQNEKRFELWLEGGRFADLVRWGKTEQLEKQNYYCPSFVDAFNDGEKEHRGYIEDNIKDAEADFWVKQYGEDAMGFKKGKHEFLPFPQRAVDLNENLKQHDGF